jgi:hypothetical protein
MKTCSPARRARSVSWILMLAMLASLVYAPTLRADQTEEEATAILTTGEWHFGGRNIGRFFKADGTYSSSNGSTGGWKIAQRTIDIRLGKLWFMYPLPVDPTGTPGTDLKGKKSELVRVDANPKNAAPDGNTDDSQASATPTPPISPDVQQAAAQVVQNYHDSLVFVTGESAAGSGFIVSMGGNNFLLTNAHVAAGIRDAQFKTLDGQMVQGGVPSIAVGEDIFCMQMPAGGKPFQIMQNVDQNAAIGDAVVVLGNAEGGGVVNTIIGKIVGIGPNLVEIDAPFVPGNSGSPIVHLKTGKVIGVATYLEIKQYDLTTEKKLPQPVVRRFGYRVDSVRGWQAVNWPAFNAQAVQMESIEKLTDDLSDFFEDIAENNGVVTVGRHTNPVIANQINDWVAARSQNLSAEDKAAADTNFLSFLKIACRTDVTTAQSQITYDYFRRELADQKQARDEMSKGFEQLIQAAGQ